jgi:hypothetical protein
MDGEYLTAERWTVTDVDGFWLMDTNDRPTAEARALENGGTIKPYNGIDNYR